MLVILKKIAYILIVLGINLYICSYINSRLVSRMELRSGYSMTKVRGLSYPAVKFFKYLSKDCKLDIWKVFILLFSFLMWSIVPFKSNLVLVDVDYSLFAGIVFYILLLVLNIANGGRTSYNFLFSIITKKTGMLLSFLIPILFSAASVALVNRSMSLKEIVNSQYEYWNIVYQPLGFIVVFTAVMLQLKLSGIGEKNVFIFTKNMHKEGGGLGEAISRLSGYMRIFFLIIVFVILYLGGWQNIYFVRGEIALTLKFYVVFILLLILDRATADFDDYKYLVSINWRFLVPISLVNFALTLGFFMFRNIFGFI